MIVVGKLESHCPQTDVLRKGVLCAELTDNCANRLQLWRDELDVVTQFESTRPCCGLEFATIDWSSMRILWLSSTFDVDSELSFKRNQMSVGACGAGAKPTPHRERSSSRHLVVRPIRVCKVDPARAQEPSVKQNRPDEE